MADTPGKPRCTLYFRATVRLMIVCESRSAAALRAAPGSWPGRVGAIGAAVVGVVLWLAAGVVSAQPPVPGDRTGRSDAREGMRPLPISELAPSASQVSPSVEAYPLELLGLLGAPPEPAPITLVPSIAVSEEYTDNLFLDNRQRQSEFITALSPTLALFVERPSYRLSAGYSFAGQLYARESRFNNAVDRQNFVANAFYQPTPRLSLSAFDSFALNRDTNLVATRGFATGRQESWSNTVGAGVTYQISRPSSVSVSATYGVLRFLGADTTSAAAGGADSDTYKLQGIFERVVTRRLTAIGSYGFAYFDFLGQADNAMTHTPSVGVAYHVTPTLLASVSGGPSITLVGGETLVNPAVTARLLETWRLGSASVQYTRTVDIAGGFGGPTETQTVSAVVALPTWQRGMVAVISPAYVIAESLGGRRTASSGNLDIKAFTLPVGVTYRLNRFTSLFAGYTFFRQRTGSASSGAVDVDQNRVRFGLQFGYPFALY